MEGLLTVMVLQAAGTKEIKGESKKQGATKKA